MTDSSLNNYFELNSSISNNFPFDPFYFQSVEEQIDNTNMNDTRHFFINNNKEKAANSTDIFKNSDTKKEKKKKGRKTKREKNEKGEKDNHNKYSFDNMLVKVKSLMKKILFDFINNKLIKIYNGEIGNGTNKEQLILLNYDQIRNATIEYNKYFLNKTIGEIFSENVSGRVNYKIEHNRELIEKLKNE